MTLETAICWWWLDILTPKRYSTLLQVFGSLDTALQEISLSMLTELGLRLETAEKTLGRLHDFNVDGYRASMEKHDVHVLTLEDSFYPSKLLQIPDMPIFLSYRGNIELLDQPQIGIVGTREMSHYGKRIVERFVPTLVRAHLVTVSGLARGVDALVATETMRAGGKTIAVLGNGLASIHPRSNSRIADDIMKNDGLILSEFPLDMEPDKYTFPARNRIIAGLSEGTLVCEAPKGSGSVITADFAIDYNREVFAVPGSVFDSNMEGCHQLLRDGLAHLVTTPEDVLRLLGILEPSADVATVYIPQTPREKSVLGVLSGLPQTADDIVEKTGCDIADVSIALVMLELAGVARVLEGGLWVRR